MTQYNGNGNSVNGASMGAGALLLLILFYLGIFITVWALQPSRVLDCDGCVDFGKVAGWSLVPFAVIIVLLLIAAALGAEGYQQVAQKKNGHGECGFPHAVPGPIKARCA